MQVLVSGASGMIGSALVEDLGYRGHRVRRLVRIEPRTPEEVRWDPVGGRLDPQVLDGVDAVVHLSGESIAGRWTGAKKRTIAASRIDSTKLLVRSIAELDVRPRVLVCASAIGVYGDRGDSILDEASEPGRSFLAGVVREWESACEPAAQAGVRVVNTRFGIVLSPSGGALKTMLTPFKAGLGGPFGGGRQWMSWVSIKDAIGAVEFALRDDRLIGPVNVVTPNPVVNAEFSRTLARVLHRPCLARTPRFALRLVLGELSDELLSSVRAQPGRLTELDYRFRFPELEPALQSMLNELRAFQS